MFQLEQIQSKKTIPGDRLIKFLGEDIVCPSWVSFITTDTFGSVWGWETKPILGHYGWECLPCYKRVLLDDSGPREVTIDSVH